MNGKQCKKIRRLTAGGDRNRPAKRAHVRGRASAAQQPKLDEARYHKPKEPVAPTWPRSKDQRAQSRPVIVLKPVRAARLAEERLAAEAEARLKHELEEAVT